MGKSLIRGFLIPFKCLFSILIYTTPSKIHITQVILSFCIILVSSFLKPYHCLCITFCCALTISIH